MNGRKAFKVAFGNLCPEIFRKRVRTLFGESVLNLCEIQADAVGLFALKIEFPSPAGNYPEE